MSQKPSLAKGTRDFLPEQARKRRYIFSVIEDCFKAFGYQPLETPAMENLSTLTGKYGEEGDKLLFKILNSGDYLKDVSEDLLNTKNNNKILPLISEKGLRYDLTVPLARTVVMNRHLISFPFKRYQIQPVWRADRPQKGRYREFYQCDADVLGSDSLMYEAELMLIYKQVFDKLQIPVKILFNHRAILEGLAIQSGQDDKFIAITVILDKLDKIGIDAVRNELIEIGMDESKANQLLNLTAQKELSLFEFNEKSKEGSRALNQILNYLSSSGFSSNVFEFEPRLARGLSYYTGTIFEVVPIEAKMGSLGGGGRYDNLTGVFGVPGISGVGISFGAERIFDVMEEHGLFPKETSSGLKLLFLVLDEASHAFAFQLTMQLRAQGISCDIYPEPGKLKKQFKYAEDIKAENIVVVGESEQRSKLLKIKNQLTGQEYEGDINSVIATLSNR